MKGRDSRGNYTNPCLTMHQPWASLLVHGIKRIEGRSWPSPIRGRLWIHAASKVPDLETIKAMEDFYREIYAINGVTDLEFPEHYPVSKLLGCVEIVGCLKGEELAGWEMVPEGVRLEALTDFCWLCEQPQKLLIPFEMRGYQGVYNLERKIYESALGGLIPVKSPLRVKFPIPDPQDWFSLKPGSIAVHFPKSDGSKVNTSSNLDVAIAGARAAATQFSRNQNSQAGQTSSTTSSVKTRQTTTRLVKEDEIDRSSNLDVATAGARATTTQLSQKYQHSQASQTRSTPSSMKTRETTTRLVKEDQKVSSGGVVEGPSSSELTASRDEKRSQDVDEKSRGVTQSPRPNSRPQSKATSKIFAAALREIKQS